MNRKRARKSLNAALVLGLLQLFSSFAFAGSADGVVVTYYAHYFNNMFIFNVANKVNRPSCDGTGRFVVDVTTDKGKTIAAAIMSAKSSGSQVYVEGGSACSIYSDSEDVVWMQVK